MYATVHVQKLQALHCQSPFQLQPAYCNASFHNLHLVAAPMSMASAAEPEMTHSRCGRNSSWSAQWLRHVAVMRGIMPRASETWMRLGYLWWRGLGPI